MKRIDDRTVEFTEDEMKINDFLDDLLDAGYGTLESVEMIRTQRLPKKFDTSDNRWLSASFVIRVLTPEFLAYLCDEDRSEVPEKNL